MSRIAVLRPRLSYLVYCTYERYEAEYRADSCVHETGVPTCAAARLLPIAHPFSFGGSSISLLIEPTADKADTSRRIYNIIHTSTQLILFAYDKPTLPTD